MIAEAEQPRQIDMDIQRRHDQRSGRFASTVCSTNARAHARCARSS